MRSLAKSATQDSGCNLRNGLEAKPWSDSLLKAESLFFSSRWQVRPKADAAACYSTSAFQAGSMGISR